MKNHVDLQFKWITLRLYNIPIIHKQIQHIVELHGELRKSILDGDILSLEKLSILNLSIRRRIAEIDQFYNKNCMDQRVRFLQTARMSLMRLISQQPSTQYQKQTVSLPWKQNKSKANLGKNITPVEKNKNEKIYPKNHLNQEQNLKNNSSLKQSNKYNHSPISSDRKIIQSDRMMYDSQATNKTPIKASRKTEFIRPKNQINPQNSSSALKKQQIRSKQEKQVPKMNGAACSSSLKKLNDLIFTIKMTKEQYHDFVDMKQRMQHTNR